MAGWYWYPAGRAQQSRWRRGGRGWLRCVCVHVGVDADTFRAPAGARVAFSAQSPFRPVVRIRLVSYVAANLVRRPVLASGTRSGTGYFSGTDRYVQLSRQAGFGGPACACLVSSLITAPKRRRKKTKVQTRKCYVHSYYLTNYGYCHAYCHASYG